MTRWFNAAAVEWVMWEAAADIPPGAAWTLAVVASFTGMDGRGAYPSAETIATITRRSRRQVQRDLDELEKRGLLLHGDRRAVAAMRADRRPEVWDLPPAAGKYIGRHRARDDKVTPRTGSRDDKTSLNGVTKTSGRDDTLSPEESLKKDGKGATHARAAGAAHDAPETPNLAPPRPGVSAMDMPVPQLPPARCCGHQLTMREYGRLVGAIKDKTAAKAAAAGGRLLCGSAKCGTGMLPAGAQP